MNKPKWVVVFDFDGTLISNSKLPFNVIDKVLPQECTAQLRILRKKYVKKSHAGLLTKKEEENWLIETIDLYVRAGLTVAKIEEAMRPVKLRNGAFECLKWLATVHIPVAIISYGVMQFIESVLKSNNAFHLVSRLYAGKLIIGSANLVTGLNAKQLVFPSNKGRYSRRFADSFGVPYQNILAIGDSGSDAKLGYLKENRLGIANDKTEAEKLKSCMGRVVITENFEPVTEWLTKKINLD